MTRDNLITRLISKVDPTDLQSLWAQTFGIQFDQPIVHRQVIRIPGLPRALDGLKIGHLSDLHRGTIVSRAYLMDAFSLLMQESPDVVALTGDYVDGSAYAAEYAEMLKVLRPRLGSFGCMGNHDLVYGLHTIPRAFRAAGVTMLRNRHHILSVKGAKLCFIGVDDVETVEASLFYRNLARGVNSDLASAMADSPLFDTVRVLLVHNPDFVMQPVFAKETAYRPIHLVLAGHTHGGQLNLPLLGTPYVPSRYGKQFTSGLVRAAGTQVYVSPGVGTGWPGRYNCSPEISLLILRSI